MNNIIKPKEKSIMPLSGDDEPTFDRADDSITPSDNVNEKTFTVRLSTLAVASNFKAVWIKSKEIMDSIYNRRNYKNGLKEVLSLVKEEFDFKEKLSLEERLKKEKKQQKEQKKTLSQKLKM